jgi:hypothetical protein
MSRNSFSYTHGETGTKPQNPLNFEENERPNADRFDWFWYQTITSINGHADEFGRLDSDNDGVVDAADGAATWSDSGNAIITHPTDIDFTGDISVTADGDGTATVSVTKYTDDEARAAVDGSNVSITGDADTVDGEHASAFADAGHLHDTRYYQIGNQVDDADTLDGEHASAFADAGHLHDSRYYTQSQVDTNFVEEVDFISTNQDGGSVGYQTFVPVATFGLDDGEEIRITDATLTKNGLDQACESGVNLTLATSDGNQQQILSGDGTTLFDDESGSPLASHENTSGSHISLAIGIDNGHFGTGFGDDTTAYAGFRVRKY